MLSYSPRRRRVRARMERRVSRAHPKIVCQGRRGRGSATRSAWRLMGCCGWHRSEVRFKLNHVENRFSLPQGNVALWATSSGIIQLITNNPLLQYSGYKEVFLKTRSLSSVSRPSPCVPRPGPSMASIPRYETPPSHPPAFRLSKFSR